ncbi:MAG: phosphatase PAP2 family protein, partial [Acidimicrobiales bacterium]
MACEHATETGLDGRASGARRRRPGFMVSLALNVVALGALWIVYASVRTVTANSWAAAQNNAQRVINFEDSLGVPSEALFQRVFLDYEWLVRAANVFYIGIHFPAMIAFLVWALITRRGAMARIRGALIGSTLVALFIHLAFPLAPPRMIRFSGFVDTAN